MTTRKFQIVALAAAIVSSWVALSVAQTLQRPDFGQGIHRDGPRGPASGASGAGVSTSRTGKAAGGGG